MCTPSARLCACVHSPNIARLRRAGTQEQFPVKLRKRKNRFVLGAAFMAERSDGAVLLVKSDRTKGLSAAWTAFRPPTGTVSRRW